MYLRITVTNKNIHADLFLKLNVRKLKIFGGVGSNPSELMATTKFKASATIIHYVMEKNSHQLNLAEVVVANIV